MNKKPFKPAPKRPAGAPRRNDRRRQQGKQDKDQHAINDQIAAPEVRLVGDNVEPGIYPIAQAMRIAEEQELDLIEIAPTATPPVCRIMDYQKFVYQQRKRAKEQKAKSTKVVVKEIRFGPQTDDHDYNFKLKHAIEFLKEGSKVIRFANDLEEYAKVDQMPVLEGKRMTIMLSPKKSSAKKKEATSADDEPAAADE